jgi:hypothetical protein
VRRPLARLVALATLGLAPALAGAWPCPASGDLDGDGAPDTVVLEPGQAGVRVAGAVVPLPVAAAAVVRICLGDVDGDGRADAAALVVAATDRDPSFRRRLFLYRGGRAALSPLFLGTAGGGPLVDIGLADLDGDGRVEVLARERTDGGERTRVYRWQSYGLVEDPALAAKAPPYVAAPPPPRVGPAGPAPRPVLGPFKPDFERSPGRIPPTAPARAAVNRRDFAWLPAAARAHLEQHGFVVVRPKEAPPEIHSVYLENEYRGWPSLVTADAALHAVHLLLDQAVQGLEAEVLAPTLAATVERLQGGLARLAAAEGPAARERLRPALRRLDVAAALLSGELPAGPDAHAVRAEVGRIEAAAQPARTPGEIDYRGFVVRGHYAAKPALARYFRANAWLALPLGPGDEAAALAAVVRRPEQQAALGALARFARVLVGPGAGLDLVDCPLRANRPAAPDWRVLDCAVPRGADGAAPPLSLLPRPLSVEAGLLAAGTDPAHRPLPSVLDVLAALGSRRAGQLLGPELSRSPAAIGNLRRAALALRGGDAADSQSIAGRWLLALRWLVLPVPEGYAPYQRSAAFADHGLVSAAASFTELRRDTVLYVQPPVVWLEGGHAPQLPPGKTGYVEPVPELYEELAALLDRLHAAALAAGGPGLERAQHPERGRGAVAALEAGTALLGFLAHVARAELAGRPLAAADHERLARIGHELEGLLAGPGTLRAEPVPVVAEIFVSNEPGTGASRRLQVATGPLDVMLAAVPVDGRVLIARGAAASFYSFEAPRPLTDAEWRARLAGPAAPLPPVWARPLPGGAPPKARRRE